MSDNMCAKTSATSRCQRCGSEFDWLSDGTKVHAGKLYYESDSLLCLNRQLDAANKQIKRLEEAGDDMVKNGWNEPHLAGKWRKAKEEKP